MTEKIFGIVLLLWGICQICAFIRYSYNERKRLYELYSNKELEE